MCVYVKVYTTRNQFNICATSLVVCVKIEIVIRSIFAITSVFYYNVELKTADRQPSARQPKKQENYKAYRREGSQK